MRRYRWAAPAGEVHRGPLAVRTLGRGRPALLLHGLGGSHRYWGADYDVLAEEGALVVPDLLGFGSSPKPATGYTADAHVDALVATLDWLGIDEPVTVGAHSVGSLVALALAARHPARVAGIIAISPPVYADGSSARSHISKMGWLERQLADGRPAAKKICYFTCRHRRFAGLVAALARPRLPRVVAADGMRHTWASFSQTFDSFILAAPADAWAVASRVPVRLLAGELDAVLDHGHLARLALENQHISLVEVAGADHDLPLARPETVIRELRALQAPSSAATCMRRPR